MIRALTAVAFSLMLVAVAAPDVYAQKGGGCDPKTEQCNGGDADCSPGYYKNHQDTWVGIACTGTACDDLLRMLNARGSGSGTLKNIAAAFLNDFFGDAASSPCTDD